MPAPFWISVRAPHWLGEPRGLVEMAQALTIPGDGHSVHESHAEIIYRAGSFIYLPPRMPWLVFSSTGRRVFDLWRHV